MSSQILSGTTILVPVKVTARERAMNRRELLRTGAAMMLGLVAPKPALTGPRGGGVFTINGDFSYGRDPSEFVIFESTPGPVGQFYEQWLRAVKRLGIHYPLPGQTEAQGRAQFDRIFQAYRDLRGLS